MGIDVVLTVVICAAVILGAIWAGTRMVSSGALSKGATGTFGSALGMIGVTGAPSNEAAAAAREEMKQQRHERPAEGPGGNGVDLSNGKATLPREPR
jgi:hypothetical protein